MSPLVVALAGGVGAARFLDGLVRVMDPRRLTVIGNVGDDAEIHGLPVSPDLDTVMYTLAGLANREQGWGLQGDSFGCLNALERLGGDAWFRLGDVDLATHLYRADRLRAGASLSQVTRELAEAMGVQVRLIPATDQRLRTVLETPDGSIEFQTYFVRRRARDRILGMRFDGADEAQAAPGVLDAIAKAAAVVLCPSNPFISIGPILSVPGVREALRATAAPVLAVSPIVGGRAIKGPAARMMKTMGHRVSAAGIAELYQDFLDVLILDRVDAAQARGVEQLGIRAVVTNTVMTGLAQKKALARAVLRAAELL